MNSVLEKYFSSKEKELYKYANEISYMFSYVKDIKVDNKEIKKILNIYLENSYKVINPNLETVLKYYNFEEDTDSEYRCILNATIKYYEEQNENIENNEKMFLTSYLIYFAVLIDKLKDTILIMPNKEDFIISIANKVSEKLKYEKDDSFKNNTKNIILMIKENIKSHNKLKTTLTRSVNKDFYNDYILLSGEYNLYKISKKINIKGLEKFKEKDIRKISEKENIDSTLKIMSYEYSQLLLLMCLLNDQRKTVALEIDENFYSKKSNINSLLKLVCNKYTKDYTKVLIKAEEYKECEELDKLKEFGIKIIIESNDIEEILSINFDKSMVLLTTLDIINEHKNELESRNIKYIKKVEEKVVSEKELIVFQKELTEVNNE